MGAWSEETFGNDSACDWVGEFLENPGLDAVKNSIDAVHSENEYLDSDIACECLAACEVIARLKGNWGVRDSYSEDLDKWIEENPISIPSDLIGSAKKAIQRIMSDKSELPELWDEDGRNEKWHTCVNNLLKRIGS